MEDIIVYSIGALVVRGLRRAVFGPSREEKLAEEVKHLHGRLAEQDSVITQQSARLQQLEEALQLPAPGAPQHPLALSLPGPSEEATGRSSFLKRSAPGPSLDEPEPSPKRSRWSLFPGAPRSEADKPAQPQLEPSSPQPSNRIPASAMDTSSNPTSGAEQPSSSDVAESSASESSDGSDSSCSEESDSAEVTEDEDCSEDESADEEASEEEESDVEISNSSGSASDGSESESDASEAAGEEECRQGKIQGAASDSGNCSGSRSDASGTSSDSASEATSASATSEEDSQAHTEADSSAQSEDSHDNMQGSQGNHGAAEAGVPAVAAAIKTALAVFKCKECQKLPCCCGKVEAPPAAAPEPLEAMPTESSEDESDREDAPEPVAEAPPATSDEEQAPYAEESDEEGSAEDEANDGKVEEIERAVDDNVEADGDEHDDKLYQAQEQIATAIYGLHLGDPGTLGREEILSDLQQMTAAINPQAAVEDARQGQLLSDQPLMNTNSDGIAAEVIPNTEHTAEAAEQGGAPSSMLDDVPYEMLDAPVASSFDLSAAQPLTAAGLGAEVQTDEESGGRSLGRRSPKRPATEEPLVDEGHRRRRRKRPRTLCRRILAILPRPLRRLTRLGGRAYWRGGRRPTSSTSGSSLDLSSPEPEVAQEAAADLTEDQAGGVVSQGSAPAVQDATQEEAAEAEEAAVMEAASDVGRAPMQASGVFLTQVIAMDDELSEEELALLAKAESEAQARQADALVTQNPRLEDAPEDGPMTENDDSINHTDDEGLNTFTPNSPQGDLQRDEEPAADHSRSPSPRRQHLSPLRSLSPLARHSRSRSGRSGSRSRSAGQRSVWWSRSPSRSVSRDSRSPSRGRSRNRRQSCSRSLTHRRYCDSEDQRSPSPSLGRNLPPGRGSPWPSPRGTPSPSPGSPIGSPRARSLPSSPRMSPYSPLSSLSNEGRGRSVVVNGYNGPSSLRRSPCRYTFPDAAEGGLRKLVRECEDLEAVSSPRAAALAAALSPLLSHPGGRKGGVLLTLSRSPSPHSRSPSPNRHTLDEAMTHQAEGGRLTGSLEDGLLGEADREEPGDRTAEGLQPAKVYSKQYDIYDFEGVGDAPFLSDWSPTGPRRNCYPAVSDLDSSPHASDPASPPPPARCFSPSPPPALRSPSARALVRSYSPSEMRSCSRSLSRSVARGDASRSQSRSPSPSRSRSRSRSASEDLAWAGRAARGRPEQPSPPPALVQPVGLAPRPGTPVPEPRAAEDVLEVAGRHIWQLEHGEIPAAYEAVPPVADPSSPVAADLSKQGACAAPEEGDLQSPRGHVWTPKPLGALSPQARLRVCTFDPRAENEETGVRTARLLSPVSESVEARAMTGADAVQPQDEPEPESIFQRNMRFAQRIFEAHKRRADARRAAARASPPLRPRAIRKHEHHKMRKLEARGRAALAAAAATVGGGNNRRGRLPWIPLPTFAFDNSTVEDTVDLTQDDNEDERPRPTSAAAAYAEFSGNAEAEPSTAAVWAAIEAADANMPLREDLHQGCSADAAIVESSEDDMVEDLTAAGTSSDRS